MEKLLGFRSLFAQLVRRGDKPLIGHNFSSDLMFFLDGHDAWLTPDVTYASFKQRVHELFPTIYDTKVLAHALSTKKLENTALEQLYESLQQHSAAHFANTPQTGSPAMLSGPLPVQTPNNNFDVVLPLGFESYHAQVIARSKQLSAAGGAGGGGVAAVAHQGAFDAYMTGIVFLHYTDRYGHDVVKERFENIVAVFGSIWYSNFRSDAVAAEVAAAAAAISTVNPQTNTADASADTRVAPKKRERHADAAQGDTHASLDPLANVTPWTIWCPKHMKHQDIVDMIITDEEQKSRTEYKKRFPRAWSVPCSVSIWPVSDKEKTHDRGNGNPYGKRYGLQIGR
jgi:hypothetical protein